MELADFVESVVVGFQYSEGHFLMTCEDVGYQSSDQRYSLQVCEGLFRAEEVGSNEYQQPFEYGEVFDIYEEEECVVIIVTWSSFGRGESKVISYTLSGEVVIKK